MNLDIITPDKSVYSGEASAITFPGTEGQFQVLNNHAPLVSTLGKGDVVVETGSSRKIYTIDGGIVEILKNRVLVLAETILS